jgi:hypothetical protein
LFDATRGWRPDREGTDLGSTYLYEAFSSMVSTTAGTDVLDTASDDTKLGIQFRLDELGV